MDDDTVVVCAQTLRDWSNRKSICYVEYTRLSVDTGTREMRAAAWCRCSFPRVLPASFADLFDVREYPFSFICTARKIRIGGVFVVSMDIYLLSSFILGLASSL